MQIVLVFLVHVQRSLSLGLLPPPKTRDMNGIQPKCMGRYHQMEVRRYIFDPLSDVTLKKKKKVVTPTLNNITHCN